MSVFPGAVDTALTLLTAVNNTKVTLNADAGIGDTTITVDDASPLPASGYLTFDDNETNPETIYYTGISGNDLTGVTRGADSTSAGAHITGAHLEQRWNATYHNTMVTELIAVMQNIVNRFGLNTDIIIPAAIRFTPPKLTTTQRDALATPTEGLVIENTTTHQLNFYDGTNWVVLVKLNTTGDVALSTAGAGVVVTTPDGVHTIRISVTNVDTDGNAQINLGVVS